MERGPQGTNAPKTVCPDPEWVVKSFKEGVISSVTSFSLVVR